MRLLTKLENIALTIITILRMLSPPSCRLLLVRPWGYIATLCAFYFCKLIGKLTAFLQRQEFSFHILPVTSSTTTRGVLLPAEVEDCQYSLHILSKDVVLRITLNIDGTPLASRLWFLNDHDFLFLYQQSSTIQFSYIWNLQIFHFLFSIKVLL